MELWVKHSGTATKTAAHVAVNKQQQQGKFPGSNRTDYLQAQLYKGG
jgi:hypothetical protein